MNFHAVRIQKFLSHAGIVSRRGAERLIQAGRVSVDGAVVRELGTRVNPSVQEVRVDGKIVSPSVATDYFLLNKPKGVLTTLRDPFGRPTIRGLLTDIPRRVFPVGRLDLDSEGLLLLTNDGEISHRLLHPRFKVEKAYHVTVQGRPSRNDIQRLQEGIEIEGRRTLPCRIRILGTTRRTTFFEVTLKEGRKRQIRNMFSAVAHPVRRLCRVRMGPLELGDLPPGRHRPLKEAEVSSLRKAVGLAVENTEGTTNKTTCRIQ